MCRGSDRGGWLVGVILAGVLAGCGPPPGSQTDAARNRFPLDAWIDLVPSDAGTVQPRVQVATPYRSLVFFRSDHLFRSGLVVRVVAWRDGQQVGGGVGSVQIDLATGEETGAATLLEAGAPIQVRGEGPVTLAVSVTVLESSRSWYRELEYAPRSLTAMPVWIAGVAPGASLLNDGESLIVGNADTLEFSVTLQPRADAPAWPANAIELVTEIAAEPLPAPLRQMRPLDQSLVAGGELVLEERWALDRLPFGRCRFRAALETEVAGERLVLPREPALELINLRVDVADDAVWRRQLDWLEGRLSEAARDSLSTTAAADRRAAWQAIWRTLAADEGQDPALAERAYLLRIVAADDRFGGYRRGALSDRGRALIRWAEPRRVETYPDAHTPGAVWEVWEYPDHDLRLLFFDAHGMGDYKLRVEEPLAP